MGFGRTIHSLATAGAIAMGLCASLTRAQVDEPVLTAAYIYNITQFTFWPNGSVSDAQLVVCANNQTSLGGELAKLAGKSYGGRVWTFASLSTNGNLARCNVMVLERDMPISRTVADFLALDQPVLVISNFDMSNHSWVVRLFTEDNHIRFDIDRSEAGRRHLSLSSRLLSLARSVL